MRLKTAIRLVSGVVLVALLAGCSRSPYGIFASIERERAILDDRNLEHDLNVGAIAKAGGTYFIAAGTLYFRDQDALVEGAWTRPEWSAVPAPGLNYTTTSLVSVDFGSGSRVFAVYSSPDGLTHGLYEINVTSPVSSPTLRLQTTGSANALGTLFAVDDGGTNGWLMVNYTTGPGAWSLYAATGVANGDGSDFAAIAGTESTEPYIDVVADATLTNVVYLRSNSLLVDTAGIGVSPGDPAGVPGRTSPARFTGALYDSVGDLFWLADNEGFLYSSPPGFAAWGRNAEAHPTSTATNAGPIPFTDFAAVPRGAATVLLVGTQGYGYRVIGNAGAVSATTDVDLPGVDGSNYEASDLATGVVQTFFVDPSPVVNYPVPTAGGDPYEYWSGHLLFAGTPGRGLWRALSSDDGPIQWLRE